MKYMLLIYGNAELWASFAPEDLTKVVQETDALPRERWSASWAENRASGEFVGAYGVADQDMAKLVRRADDGLPAVTDGPYIEAKEYIGSFDIIDVESEARALEIAARVPFARFGPVEVRPIMHEAAPDV